MTKLALWLAAFLAVLIAGRAHADSVCVSPSVWMQFDVCPAALPPGRDPSKVEADFAIAEGLFQSDEACGDAFDKVYEDDPASAFASRAISKSVVCRRRSSLRARLNELNRRSFPGGATPVVSDPSARFASKPIGTDDRATLASFDRFLCAVHADSGAAEDVGMLAGVEFARARIYFDAQRWEEAALGFRKVAFEHPEDETAIAAAQLYLEALNVLGAHADPPRPSCFAAMGEDLPKLLELHCADTKPAANEASCGILRRVERDIERLEAERAYEAASQHVGTSASVEAFRVAAEAYLRLWEKYGRRACEAGDIESCARSDEILSNAAYAFLSAKDVDRAISVWQVLVDPKFHLNDTDLGRRAVYRIGAQYQATARFEDAATWFERFARESPKDESAPDALSSAITLRLALGKIKEAIEDGELFAKGYGAKLPQRTAYLQARIADDYIAHEDWDLARKAYTAAMGGIEKSGPADAIAVAHARLGRAYSRLGKLDEAKREFAKVRAASTSEAALSAIEKDPSADERARDARRNELFDAFAEAAFFFAEAERLALPQHPLPPFRGDADRSAANTFIADELRALEPVFKAFGAIREASHDLAGGRWIALGAARVLSAKAKLYASVVEARGSDALASDQSALLIDVNATARSCVEIGAQRWVADESTAECERWLVDHDPTFVPVVEFWSPASRVFSGTERPFALTREGEPATGLE